MRGRLRIRDNFYQSHGSLTVIKKESEPNFDSSLGYCVPIGSNAFGKGMNAFLLPTSHRLNIMVEKVLKHVNLASNL